MTTHPPDGATAMTRAIVLKHLFVKAVAAPPLALAKQKFNWSDEEAIKFVENQRDQNAHLVEQLRQAGPWNEMEADERSFIEADSGDFVGQVWIDKLWVIESIMCLLWSLRYLSDLLPYDRQADRQLLNKFPQGPVGALVQNAVLRSRELLEAQRDAAELWHWRSRTRKLQESGYKFPLPGGTTIEKLIRTTSAKAAMDGVIPGQTGDDFPAFGKAYRDLTRAEYLKATSIAMERHRAFNWLCGLAPGNRWAETPIDT